MREGGLDRWLFDAERLDRRLEAGEDLVTCLREFRDQGDAVIESRFRDGTPARVLVAQRAALIDGLLTRAWQRLLPTPGGGAALVAVGGYGRGNLHPGSDIDVMILLPDQGSDANMTGAEAFVTALWDIGLEVGHSVRSVRECREQAAADITVATNLLEARLLCGAPDLFDAMREATSPAQVWPVSEFFRAKLREQEARHAKFHDTAYNLEPHVKESPGGLRDLHMIGWVAKRHFNVRSLHDLVGHGFLTEAEYDSLARGRNFLWDIRFALHLLTGRREDRLLFDHQIAMAKQFGFADEDHALGVEALMQRYFRVVGELSRLNEMLLQLFQEAILYADDTEPPQLINKRFQSRRGFIEVTHPKVFQRYPFALLEVFLLMQQQPGLKGVRAATIRLIREHRHLIDERFRSDLRARSLFMEILRQPHGITHELRRMHRYGVLGKYIPTFGMISGLMQYDLFHAYTVDSHTLTVIRNLRRFALARHADELPLCNSLMQRLPKPELLYLAGLFHDIAKGRGGDHSILGARDAEVFCIAHGLGAYDARLVAWLVRHHLLMSMTAQRKDISDPEVIARFAAQVGDRTRLDYLYLLTVADIRATNPALWNSWRDSLLMELYTATSRTLRRGLEHPIDDQELIRDTQQQARRLLKRGGLHHMTVARVWKRFTDDYFLRHTADEIAWHTAAIARCTPADLPLVLLDPSSPRGGSAVFVYARDHGLVFGLTAQALERLNLSIQDARIITTDDEHSLNSYLILEASGEPVQEAWRVEEIVGGIRDNLTRERLEPVRYRLRTRAARSFTTATAISFSLDEASGRTAMELICADRPGLLARVGYCLANAGVRLRNAKIATVGARAEDVFFITDARGRPITDQAWLDALRAALIAQLKDEEHTQSLVERANGL
jgi:[protein-PII] uridylyltransferase